MKKYMFRYMIIAPVVLYMINSLQAQIELPTDEIYNWNTIATSFVTKNGSGHDGIPPMVESRIYAMTFIAMHDVINHISPKYKTYTPFNKGWHTANLNAAIAQASFEILSHELPQELEMYKAELERSFNKIKEGDAKSQGISLGNKIATAILKLRIDDNSAVAQYPIEPGTKPGEYVFTGPFAGPPFNTPPSKGFIATPGWRAVKPFGVISVYPYLPAENPYPLTSKKYAKDYNEIKSQGCMECPRRTNDQKEYALFWSESSCLGWNKIASQVSKKEKMAAHEIARMFALLHIGIADSYILSMEAKMKYYTWRPVTAIQQGDLDNNNLTSPDQGWKELGYPTVPVPEFPSAHANAGGAAAAILVKIFKKDQMKFTLTSTITPGVTRSFTSFTSAARENSNSRIYLGYHFRQAVEIGEAMGIKLGNFIAKNALPLIK